MTARWAPIAAAAAVAGLVVTIALVTGGPADPDAPEAVAPAQGSATASAAPPAEPSSAPDSPVSSPAAPSAEPTAAPPAAEPSSSPAARRPAPSPTSPPPAPAAPPPPPPKPEPEPTPQAGRTALPFDAAYGTDEPYEVVVQYGDSSSCPHENVTKKVRESADAVVVALTADTQPADRACTADYRQMLVPVRLAQPLGSRRVIDAATGREVEVDRKCSRPFQDPPPPRDCTP